MNSTYRRKKANCSISKIREIIYYHRGDFIDKGPYDQSCGFSSSHVWMCELDHKESWTPNSWCFWTVVLENTRESPLDSKDIKPVSPKGNQSWTFIGRTDTEPEALILWLPDVKSWPIGKGPDAGKEWRQEEKGSTEDEMVGWHHRVWENSRSWWWTEKPGVLQSIGLHRVGQDWVTKLNHCEN